MRRGPLIATIEVRVVPFDGGYAFDVDYCGVPLEDHPPADRYPSPLSASTITRGLERIGAVLDEIEQAGP